VRQLVRIGGRQFSRPEITGSHYQVLTRAIRSPVSGSVALTVSTCVFIKASKADTETARFYAFCNTYSGRFPDRSYSRSDTPGGKLRRNHFAEVRDADFQRGLNKAVENNWLKLKPRDRYTYELTEAGFRAS